MQLRICSLLPLSKLILSREVNIMDAYSCMNTSQNHLFVIIFEVVTKNKNIHLVKVLKSKTGARSDMM